ncbi:Hpt domain-containing protein [Zunongwangia sp. F363]|uniref:Hpt domain-containing protein n=1 Tax=Autumnicola tepida TaxID=3075595 RepID=A0ABU3CBV1_9FLAO|nr:Hpt domain-containing protein [Zunongwangia sp. F363]MDT0643819.1 Hpt domain-containing protein [Zunongwangia sp. F363]
MKEAPNLSYIHQLSDGNKDFEEKLLNVVRRELPEEIEVFKQNIRNKNYKEASANVHKLKHKISILGLEKTYHLAEDYESELREGENKRQAEFEEKLQMMLAFVQQS